MDLCGKLQLKWSVGYDGSAIHFINNSTLVYGSGNGLCMVDQGGKHVQSLPSHGSGVGPIATAPQAGTIVYAESTLNPRIFAVAYPSCKVIATLKDGAELGYAALAVSSNGKRLASLSGLPDFLLVLWDVQEGCELCRTNVGPGGYQLSLNPLNWRQMCVMGADKLTFYSLEQCNDDQLMLTAQETKLPEKNTPVGSTVQPPLPPLSSPQQKPTKPDETELKHTVSDHSRPPDLSGVLYKETYNNYTEEGSSVVPVSHCWSSQQTVYVGCRGGQLLVADFETGTIKVMANPELAQLSSHSLDEGATPISAETIPEEPRGTEGDSTPKTAHAVLANGSLECLAFSKRGLFTAGKSGALYCFAPSAELQVLESHSLASGDTVSYLSWSPDYSRMAVGTHQAAIHMTDPLHLSACSLLSAHGNSPIVGLDVLTPGSEHIVTCRVDGTLQVWSIEDAGLISSYSLEQEVCCVACPMSSHVAVVGCASGHLCVVGVTQPASPALLVRTRLYRSPISAIRYDQNGRFLVIAASGGPVFVCSALPTTGFRVVGHTGIKGEIVDLSVVMMEPGSQGATLTAVLSQHDEKTLITLFQLPNSVTETTPPDLYSGAANEFSSDFIWKQEAMLTEPASRFLLSSQTTAFAPLNKSLKLAKLTLPPLKEKDVDWELSPDITLPAHDMDSVQVELSFHQKWMASAARDGKVAIRLVENPAKAVTCTPHHYQTDGCKALVLSRDCQHILTVGDKGTITCWKWDFTNHGSLKGQTAREYLQRVLRSLGSQHSRENSALDGMTHITDKTLSKGERTWLEVAEEEVHKAEDEKYSELKSELRGELGELRQTLLGMIDANERAPDMEKLGREEFILDMEEHDRLQAEEAEQIQQVKEEIELSNLAKMFLREQIKRECWNSMSVKGKVIKGFQGTLEVSNYPMMSRSEQDQKELARVRTLRAIELADRAVRCEAVSRLERTPLTEELGMVLGEEEEEGEGDTRAQEEGEDAAALFGSHGPKYGGGCDLLYNQFELHSPVAKKHQIVLLQECVHCIKETFNKEFEEVVRLKQAEIARIREKNVRILKIVHQLQLDEELVQPTLYPEEQPEGMLTVQDREVKVEKYLSPEEKKKQEEAAKLEEEKRLAEMGDNPRERALDMMMGGRLEANVEEDLFKDFPRPDFMLKEPAEMSEEEIRAAREFEKKEAEFLEEREKLKKALEGELRKLQSTITQAMENFNERLQKLFQLKINTEMAVHQEELKMVGLVSTLQVEEEVRGREEQLNTLLKNKKTMKAQLSSVISSAKHTVKECREQYEHMLAEDKDLERAFKRDFADCEPYVDQLYKLFKRRPRGQKLKPGPSEGGLVSDPKSQNPFPQRPPSAVGGGQKLATRGSGEDAMTELDRESHIPDGVEASQWERLVAARRRKWDSETKVKVVALNLADMEAFLKRRLVEEERVQQEIQDAFRELNRLGEDKTLFNLDLQVQLLLKQGQVEIDEGDFVPDYSGSVLVHRRVIEELNKEIKTHGEAKLASMTECKDFKRGIRMLEWECRRLQMEREDMQERARDVQLLRVTKDLQLRLNENGQARRDQHDAETLEKTLELNEKTHKKKVREKKRQLTKLQAQGKKRREENRELDRSLMDRQVSVLERQATETLAGIPPSEAGARQRMADIVGRRRHVELARAQAAEINLLRSELERLRMATFPALVQVD